MFESDRTFLYIIHFIVHAEGNMNENKKNTSAVNRKYMRTKRLSVCQPNATTNNQQKTSSEGTGCDHDFSGEKRVRQKGEELQLLLTLPAQKYLRHILKSNTHPNLIHTSFAYFLNEKEFSSRF
jgi:hypothetical protein